MRNLISSPSPGVLPVGDDRHDSGEVVELTEEEEVEEEVEEDESRRDDLCGPIATKEDKTIP